MTTTSSRFTPDTADTEKEISHEEQRRGRKHQQGALRRRIRVWEPNRFGRNPSGFLDRTSVGLMNGDTVAVDPKFTAQLNHHLVRPQNVQNGVLSAANPVEGADTGKRESHEKLLSRKGLLDSMRHKPFVNRMVLPSSRTLSATKCTK